MRSFINISDQAIEHTVEDSLSEGRLWPQPLLQFNPAYEQAGTVEEVIASRLLHDDVRRHCQLSLLLAELPHAQLPRLPVFP